MIDLTQKTIEAFFEDVPEFVTKQQLLDKLGFSNSGPAASLALQRWMTRQGWHVQRRQVDGVRVWGYARNLASQPSELSDAPTGSAIEQLRALVEAVRIFRNEPGLARLGGLRGTAGYTGLCLVWEGARDWLDAIPAPSRAIGEVVVSTSLTGDDGLQMIKWADDAPPITVGMKVYAAPASSAPSEDAAPEASALSCKHSNRSDCGLFGIDTAES